MKYPKLKEIIGTRLAEVSTARGKDLLLRNTNRLLWSDEDLIGGKTGYTRQARHCFVCAAEREKDTIVVALLGSPSRINLWKETESLIDKGFNIIANREEPVIYFTKADYDTLNVKKVAYKKKSRYHGKALKTKKKSLIGKKKDKVRTIAKSKKGKDYRVLEGQGYFIPLGMLEAGAYHVELDFGRDADVRLEVLDGRFRSLLERNECAAADGKMAVAFALDSAEQGYARSLVSAPLQVLRLKNGQR